MVVHPTRHKIGHFGDIPPANLLAWYGKTKPNTTKAHIHQSKQMYYNTKKLKPGLVTSYNIWPGNGEGLFQGVYKSNQTNFQMISRIHFNKTPNSRVHIDHVYTMDFT